jgi:hypothetical protein
MWLLGDRLTVTLKGGLGQEARLQPDTEAVEATVSTAFDRFEIAWSGRVVESVPLDRLYFLSAGDQMVISGGPREQLADAVDNLLEGKQLVAAN